jgi:hypothetical protein
MQGMKARLRSLAIALLFAVYRMQGMKARVRSLAIALLFAVYPLAVLLSATRLQSRFAISWVHVILLGLLSVPAALMGGWLVATSLLAAGLVLIGVLVLLDRRDRLRRTQRPSE